MSLIAIFISLLVPYLSANATCWLADTVTFVSQNVVKVKSDTDFCRHSTLSILREQQVLKVQLRKLNQHSHFTFLRTQTDAELAF